MCSETSSSISVDGERARLTRHAAWTLSLPRSQTFLLQNLSKSSISIGSSQARRPLVDDHNRTWRDPNGTGAHGGGWDLVTRGTWVCVHWISFLEPLCSLPKHWLFQICKMTSWSSELQSALKCPHLSSAWRGTASSPRVWPGGEKGQALWGTKRNSTGEYISSI